MNDTDPINEQLRPLRDLPTSSRVMALDRLWLWQKLGVVLGVLIAVLVASLTLTPIPDRATSINGLDKLYHFVAFAALIFSPDPDGFAPLALGSAPDNPVWRGDRADSAQRRAIGRVA